MHRLTAHVGVVGWIPYHCTFDVSSSGPSAYSWEKILSGRSCMILWRYMDCVYKTLFFRTSTQPTQVWSIASRIIGAFDVASSGLSCVLCGKNSVGRACVVGCIDLSVCSAWRVLLYVLCVRRSVIGVSVDMTLGGDFFRRLFPCCSRFVSYFIKIKKNTPFLRCVISRSVDTQLCKLRDTSVAGFPSAKLCIPREG